MRYVRPVSRFGLRARGVVFIEIALLLAVSGSVVCLSVAYGSVIYAVASPSAGPCAWLAGTFVSFAGARLGPDPASCRYTFGCRPFRRVVGVGTAPPTGRRLTGCVCSLAGPFEGWWLCCVTPLV